MLENLCLVFFFKSWLFDYSTILNILEEENNMGLTFSNCAKKVIFCWKILLFNIKIIVWQFFYLSTSNMTLTICL